MSAGLPDAVSTSGVADRLVQGLSENPYFNAGAGLAGLGMAAALGKRSLILANALFRRRFVTSLTLNNEDAAYPWVLDFINRHSSQKARAISASSVIRQTESGRVSTSFYLLPGYGTHYFTHKYRWIQVERTREKHQVQRSNGLRTALETVTLTTLGGSPLIWRDLLGQAAQEALDKEETGLVVYHAVGPEWHRMGNPRRKRPLESVVLAKGLADTITADFQEFVRSEDWYVSRGVPYRRGYLFHGPPGTGKSSFISALAGHFGYSICMLSLSERTLDDDRLAHLLNSAPPNALLLLEDVDAAFVSRDLFENAQHRAFEGMTRVTFSGLLNAIDGVASAEERVLFMTTNHVHRLDPALIRPGRVDVQCLFDDCTDDMLADLFRRFYEEVPAELTQRFVEQARKLGALSPAHVQGHLLRHKHDPEAAVRTVADIIK